MHAKKTSAKKRKVRDAVRTRPKPLQTQSSLAEASETMRSAGAKKFPVAAGDKLVGTVQDDFVDRKATQFGHDPAETLVGDTMSAQRHFCFVHDSLEHARRVMEKEKLTHLPVVDADLHIIGLLGLEDLRRARSRRRKPASD